MTINMELPAQTAMPFERIEIDRYEVSCDGGDGALGHPRVFLHIDHDTGSIVCPYCSRTFIYNAPH